MSGRQLLDCSVNRLRAYIALGVNELAIVSDWLLRFLSLWQTPLLVIVAIF